MKHYICCTVCILVSVLLTWGNFPLTVTAELSQNPAQCALTSSNILSELNSCLDILMQHLNYSNLLAISSKALQTLNLQFANELEALCSSYDQAEVCYTTKTTPCKNITDLESALKTTSSLIDPFRKMGKRLCDAYRDPSIFQSILEDVNIPCFEDAVPELRKCYDTFTDATNGIDWSSAASILLGVNSLCEPVTKGIQCARTISWGCGLKAVDIVTELVKMFLPLDYDVKCRIPEANRKSKGLVYDKTTRSTCMVWGDPHFLLFNDTHSTCMAIDGSRLLVGNDYMQIVIKSLEYIKPSKSHATVVTGLALYFNDNTGKYMGTYIATNGSLPNSFFDPGGQFKLTSANSVVKVQQLDNLRDMEISYDDIKTHIRLGVEDKFYSIAIRMPQNLVDISTGICVTACAAGQLQEIDKEIKFYVSAISVRKAVEECDSKLSSTSKFLDECKYDIVISEDVKFAEHSVKIQSFQKELISRDCGSLLSLMNNIKIYISLMLTVVL